MNRLDIVNSLENNNGLPVEGLEPYQFFPAAEDALVDNAIAQLEAMDVPPNPVDRGHYQLLRNPALAGTFRHKYRMARFRLVRVMAPGGDLVQKDVPVNIHQFTAAEFPGYIENGENHFFLDDNARVQRCQKSDLSSLQAVATVASYKISHTLMKRGLRPDHPMMNVTEMIKNDKVHLWELILHDHGVDTQSSLSRVLGNASTQAVNPKDKDLPEYLKNYGPALICKFRVHQDFLDQSVRRHVGVHNGEHIGIHAMVLVATREENGTRYLLLQNWWQQKQFVEMDVPYFLSCGGNICFVDSEHDTPADGFALQHGNAMFETDKIDSAERCDGDDDLDLSMPQGRQWRMERKRGGM